MAYNDLTTLARVKSYMAITGTDLDEKLGLFISRVSSSALAFMNRDTLNINQYSEILDGTGNAKIMLPQWPVLSVSSVAINTMVVPASENPPIGAGFFWDRYDGFPPGSPGRLLASGWAFTRGNGNIAVSYTAGYGALNEAWVIPASHVTPLQKFGIISGDAGVTYADGTALEAVSSSPLQGQYIPPDPLAGAAATDYYTFSAADEGASVLISYSIIPTAIEGAVCQWVAEQWAYKDRVGLQSKTLGGQETITYIVGAMPTYCKQVLSSFKNVVPL